MEISLLYPESEIINTLKELKKVILRCPKCNSIYLDNDTETFLLKQKGVIKNSVIPGGKFTCSNSACYHYGQYISKMEVENRALIKLLASKIQKLEYKIKNLK